MDEEEAIGIAKALEDRNQDAQLLASGFPNRSRSESAIQSRRKAQAVVNDLVKMFEQGDEQRMTEASAEAGRLASQISEVEARLQELAPERDLELIRIESMYQSRDGAAGRFEPAPSGRVFDRKLGRQ